MLRRPCKTTTYVLLTQHSLSNALVLITTQITLFAPEKGRLQEVAQTTELQKLFELTPLSIRLQSPESTMMELFVKVIDQLPPDGIVINRGVAVFRKITKLTERGVYDGPENFIQFSSVFIPY